MHGLCISRLHGDAIVSSRRTLCWISAHSNNGQSEFVANEEFEALFPNFPPSRVTNHHQRWQIHSTRVNFPGHPRESHAEDEIAVKFTALGVRRHRLASMQESAEVVYDMETAASFDYLVELTRRR